MRAPRNSRRHGTVAGSPTERIPAAERAGVHIRELLFAGAVRPGDRIDQNEIAATLGISRQPVREAVLELAGDGILVIRPHHGVFVGRFDAETVRGHYELNGYLEAYAAAKVARLGDGVVIGRLRELHEVVLGSGDPVTLQRAASEFYRTIIVATGNPRLRSTMRVLERFVPGPAFVRYPALLEGARRANSELLAAIETGDPSAAAAICVEQWRAGGEIVVQDLVARGIIATD